MVSYKRAFTLIELLVVIAIIAILAAILFPVFAQAKAAAKKTAAISNTKQILLSGMQYSDDNEGRQIPRYDACGGSGINPPNTTSNGGKGTKVWPELVQMYMKNQEVFSDPAAPDKRYFGWWTVRGYGTIGMNATIQSWYFPSGDPVCNSPFNPKTVDQMPNPARWVWFMSSYGGDTALGYRGYLADNGQANAIFNSTYNYAGLSTRHNSGTVIAMYDGHAKWYPGTAILGNINSTWTCVDTSFQTGQAWMDINGAKLKFNILDTCILEP